MFMIIIMTGPKKVKGKPLPPRKPYHIYTGLDGLEIRVGRGASDNDELSCNPEHRDGADWWMHVAGCAGSCSTLTLIPTLTPTRTRTLTQPITPTLTLSLTQTLTLTKVQVVM